MNYAPGVIRTHNLLIRSQMLYPIELRVRKDPEASAKTREVKRAGPRYLGHSFPFRWLAGYGFH
jgi:hypothetical protein